MSFKWWGEAIFKSEEKCLNHGVYGYMVLIVLQFFVRSRLFENVTKDNKSTR